MDDVSKSGIEAVKLWEWTLSQEQFFLEAHQKRFAFFSSLISAILAATIAGIMRADASLDFITLLFGPALIFVFALIGRAGTFRFYQRFLETITIRAKTEQILGLANPRELVRHQDDHWAAEPIIPDRHLKIRKDFASSEEFIERMKNEGYQKSVNQVFLFFKAVAIFLAALLILAATTLK